MTSPLAAGYVSAYLLITEDELSALRLNVAAFARESGYTLHSFHVEELPSAPEAFQSLIEQVTAEDITTVLVPSLHHFAAIGNPLEIKERLEQLIGGRVIATGYTP